MSQKNVPAKNDAVFFSVGIVFLILGLNDYHSNGSTGAFVYVTIGLVFCMMSFAKSRSERGKRAKNVPPESECHPDGAEQQNPPLDGDEPEEYEEPVPNDSDGLQARREDLKALYESGILTKEEYQERMKKLRQDWK